MNTSLMNKNSAYWSRLAVAAITEPEALTELYEYYFPRVYQHILKKTGDSSLADELVSDTFMRMYEHLDQFDPQRGAFSTWLFRIAQNSINSYYGSKSYVTAAPWDEEFDPSDPHGCSPEKQALGKERTEELKKAIQKLPQRQQQILEMAYWLEMSSNEIAEKLGSTPGSIRVTLNQARNKLKELLEEK